MATKNISPKQLEVYRKRLTKLHSRLSGDVKNLEQEVATGHDSLVEREAYFADEIETDIVLGENDEKILFNVSSALERIDAGTFGLCCDCEQKIGAARLGAIPFTPYCIECERRHEETGR